MWIALLGDGDQGRLHRHGRQTNRRETSGRGYSREVNIENHGNKQEWEI
jgi:hypothetical protein